MLLNQSEKVIKEAMDHLMSNPLIYGKQPKDMLFFSHGIVCFKKKKHENIDAFIRDADEQMYYFKNADWNKQLIQ